MPALPAGQRWVAVNAGCFHTCGLTSAETLVCWGDTTHGATTVPPLPTGEYWAKLGVGPHFRTCAITGSGGLICFGFNNAGELTIPALSRGETWTAAATGHQHTCGVSSAGALICWGSNYAGKTSVPTLPVGEKWSATIVGAQHSCGVSSAGRMTCWGAYDGGRTTVPVLPAGQTWTVGSAGDLHTCAISTAGALACWGTGILPWTDFKPSGASTVPKLLGAQTWVEVFAGTASTCARDSAGGLQCWGYGPPTKVPAISTAAAWGAISPRSSLAFVAVDGCEAGATIMGWTPYPPFSAHIANFQALLGTKPDGTGYSRSVELLDGSKYHSQALFGTISIKTAGKYFFDVYSDDTQRLIIDGTTITYFYGARGVTNVGNAHPQNPVDLTAGIHDIQIEWSDSDGGYVLYVKVRGPDYVGVSVQRGLASNMTACSASLSDILPPFAPKSTLRRTPFS